MDNVVILIQENTLCGIHSDKNHQLHVCQNMFSLSETQEGGGNYWCGSEHRYHIQRFCLSFREQASKKKFAHMYTHTKHMCAEVEHTQRQRNSNRENEGEKEDEGRQGLGF